MNALLQSIVNVIPQIIIPVPLLGSVNITSLLVGVSVFILLTALFALVRKVVLGHLVTLSKKTNTDIDDVIIDAITGIKVWVYTLVALYISLQFFSLPALAMKISTGIFLVAVVWQLIEIATCFVAYGSQRFLEKDEDEDGAIDPGSATASAMVQLIARIVMWALGALFVLSNLGIEVTSLLAGLGIGGIAIAFALQGILSDLFASFSLYFDRPFRVGDYIVIGADSGTVEKIGIKTTRMRTLQGEELVVSNTELTTARVQNFKKMEERRTSFSFGITYETPAEKVKAVTGMVEDIFAAVTGARLDRVHFTSFGDSALIYDVVFYVESAEYAEYLDIQQKVNFQLMDVFAQEGIEFAYPTQTLFMKKAD